jgi:beta-lactamase class A
MAAVKKIENGQWKWENELVLMAGDKDSEFGTLYKSPIGTRFSIEALVSSVLKDSDNTAYFMLLRNIEKEEMQGVWEHLGLQDFVSKDGKISAKRYAVILRSLYNAAFLSEENSNKILKILSESTSAGYIEQGIPKNIPLAHKIGVSSIEQVYMDAGLIYVPNRPYVLIIMTHGKSVEEAKQVMKDISQKTYDYVSGYNDAN